MAVATSTAMAAAKIMGIASAVVAVISMIKMTPVIGARTTAAKNVDMPTIANATWQLHRDGLDDSDNSRWR